MIATESQEFARVNEAMRDDASVFVFGSNLAGVHGAGAAAAAHQLYGARWGYGTREHGRSYAIPTKDAEIETLPVEQIAGYVADFLLHAEQHPAKRYIVTRVGCGLAGYRDEEIAVLFRGAPFNCELPIGWRELSA